MNCPNGRLMCLAIRNKAVVCCRIQIFTVYHLTPAQSRPTIRSMDDTTSKINHLEEQVNELLELAKRLGDENNSLRSQIKQLSGQRSTLLELKETARSNVEAMISRLRSMESA